MVDILNDLIDALNVNNEMLSQYITQPVNINVEWFSQYAGNIRYIIPIIDIVLAGALLWIGWSIAVYILNFIKLFSKWW